MRKLTARQKRSLCVDKHGLGELSMNSENVQRALDDSRCAAPSMSAGEGQPTRQRKVIPTTCSVHGGGRGYTNLAVSQIDGEIVLDPHLTGGCVIVFEEKAAKALLGVLQEWLG